MPKPVDVYRLNRDFERTDAEKRAFPKLYRLITPFRWPTFCLLRWAVRNQKSEFFDSILDWMLYQFYRTDIGLE